MGGNQGILIPSNTIKFRKGLSKDWVWKLKGPSSKYCLTAANPLRDIHIAKFTHTFKIAGAKITGVLDNRQYLQTDF
jgi:hypothetical protein